MSKKTHQHHPNDPTLEPSDLNVPIEPPIVTARLVDDPPTKKPRTASPVQLASRAFQRMCDLQAQRAREAARHAEHVAKTDRDIAAIEAELEGMPEVRRLFEGLRAAAEGAS